jgi:6-pyruvoyltetrahydropterin/6-carboxytetrahydropterin synthase
MFELTVHTVFSAAHAIVIAGVREPLHGHDWHVTACVAGDALDAEGLLIDFHALEETLAAIVRPFRNANLNDTPPFDRANPTAENVARHIGETLAERTHSIAPPPRGVRVAWVRVTEAPGCAVTYRM